MYHGCQFSVLGILSVQTSGSLFSCAFSYALVLLCVSHNSYVLVLFFLIILYFTLLYLIHTYLLSSGRQKWDRFRREGTQEGAGRSTRGKHYQDIVCEKKNFKKLLRHRLFCENLNISTVVLHQLADIRLPKPKSKGRENIKNIHPFIHCFCPSCLREIKCGEQNSSWALCAAP